VSVVVPSLAHSIGQPEMDEGFYALPPTPQTSFIFPSKEGRGSHLSGVDFSCHSPSIPPI